MQFFSLVNSLLLSDIETSRQNLAIQRFAVIPLSTNSGLLGWVPHSDTLHGLIKDYRDKKKILLNIEHRIMQRMTANSDHLPLINKVEVFEQSLDQTPGDDLAKILLLKAPSSEVWFERRTNFTRSLAVMSMVGYVLGLGDRHPSNLLLDRMSGKILHIDFGDCFEVAMTREKFPEKIPFRLTRMLIQAMEVTGIEGSYRTTCEAVMRVLRHNKDSLMAVLEAFVYDPLLKWRLVETDKKAKKTKVAPAAAIAVQAAGGAQQPPQQQPQQQQQAKVCLTAAEGAVAQPQQPKQHQESEPEKPKSKSAETTPEKAKSEAVEPEKEKQQPDTEESEMEKEAAETIEPEPEKSKSETLQNELGEQHLEAEQGEPEKQEQGEATAQSESAEEEQESQETVQTEQTRKQQPGETVQPEPKEKAQQLEDSHQPVPEKREQQKDKLEPEPEKKRLEGAEQDKEKQQETADADGKRHEEQPDLPLPEPAPVRYKQGNPLMSESQQRRGDATGGAQASHHHQPSVSQSEEQPRPTEEMNKKALDIIQRVRDKLTGRDFSREEILDVAEQVDRLIEQATDNMNLCQSYIGWCPFW